MAQLAEFAGKFGSDLPFFFHGPSSVCTGRGENVTPIAPPRPRWAVIYLPDIVMPTPQVYRRFDEMKLGNERDVLEQPDWKAWAELQSTELLPLLINDLEAPAFSINKYLSDLRDYIQSSIYQPVRMSGSGSSLFSLFDDPQEAEKETTRHALGCGQVVRAIAVEVAPQVGWHSTPRTLLEKNQEETGTGIIYCGVRLIEREDRESAPMPGCRQAHVLAVVGGFHGEHLDTLDLAPEVHHAVDRSSHQSMQSARQPPQGLLLVDF